MPGLLDTLDPVFDNSWLVFKFEPPWPILELLTTFEWELKARTDEQIERGRAILRHIRRKKARL